mmetsp:Transcript_100452/g.282292  ORF Transcript_100452/g.282292 Transcript_100452/m.282292 type:complete len:244 (+) Transcript_100452:1737-2468(+)
MSTSVLLMLLCLLIGCASKRCRRYRQAQSVSASTEESPSRRSFMWIQTIAVGHSPMLRVVLLFLCLLIGYAISWRCQRRPRVQANSASASTWESLSTRSYARIQSIAVGCSPMPIAVLLVLLFSMVGCASKRCPKCQRRRQPQTNSASASTKECPSSRSFVWTLVIADGCSPMPTVVVLVLLCLLIGYAIKRCTRYSASASTKECPSGKSFVWIQSIAVGCSTMATIMLLALLLSLIGCALNT